MQRSESTNNAGVFAEMVEARRAELWTLREHSHSPEACEHEMVSADDEERRWKCCDLWQRKLSNKLNAKAFAQRHGVRVAKLLWHGPLEEVPYGRLAESYVLKLSNGWNGDQVIPVSEGYDVLHRTRVDAASLRRRLHRMFLDVGDPYNLVLLEEFIGNPGDGVPLDYKLFCFHGKAKVLYISNRNTGTLTWFDREWNPIEEIIHSSKPPGPERQPPYADRLIEEAEHLARAYEYPFVRIDLYRTRDRVFFGEFTHTPFDGDLHRFTDFANQVLADLWLHPETSFPRARRLRLRRGCETWRMRGPLPPTSIHSNSPPALRTIGSSGSI